MGYLLVGIVIFFVICFVMAAHNSKYGVGDARVQFKRGESGTSVCTGRGKSLGEAMADGFIKLYSGLSPNSRVDTIQSRYDVMVQNLSENRDRMFQRDIAICEDYIYRTKLLLDKKEKSEAEKIAAKENSESVKIAERKRKEAARSAERKKKEAARLAERKRKEAALPEQRRFVAEQRRLMTDALRYEILRRDGFRCQICGATAQDGYKLHVDHIIPVSKGGRTEPSNLRTLCERCNMGKSDQIEDISLDVGEHPKRSGEKPKNDMPAEPAPEPVQPALKEPQRSQIKEPIQTDDMDFIGETITGNGWKILFDSETARTRVMFDEEPTDAARSAVENAGFYYSPYMNSYNKKLTKKAHRAALALADTLRELCGE